MKTKMFTAMSATLIGAWCAGVVVAEGFYNTVASLFIVPYSWYVLAEKIITVAG